MMTVEQVDALIEREGLHLQAQWNGRDGYNFIVNMRGGERFGWYGRICPEDWPTILHRVLATQGEALKAMVAVKLFGCALTIEDGQVRMVSKAPIQGDRAFQHEVLKHLCRNYLFDRT